MNGVDLVKAIVKAIFRMLGLVVMKRSSRVYLPEDDSYRIAIERCGRVDPVIIDGGAHRGGSVEAFSKFAPAARFHCFEPDPLLAKEIIEKFSGQSNISFVQAALGSAPGKASFNINVSRPTNSLLPVADGLQSDLQGLCQAVEQLEVEVTSIDAYCASQAVSQVDVIKLDLQGYDYRALLGAKNTLEKARVVLVEVLFIEIYKGCNLFPDVIKLMGESGFVLHTLCGIHYGESDELLWADAIFVNSRLP